MGNRDRRGREAKKPKQTKDKRVPAKSWYERPPGKPATPSTPPAPGTAPQS
jgi:hypothetical protein